MKRINTYISEKLKISSKTDLPSIEEFIAVFNKYYDKTFNEKVNFQDLESIGRIDFENPQNYIHILPEYKIKGNEDFLKLPYNKFIKMPTDSVYIYVLQICGNTDTYFMVRYAPSCGINSKNLSSLGRRNIYINPEDVIDIIGEDLYLEIYKYLLNETH
jgi:hypothetical protein